MTIRLALIICKLIILAIISNFKIFKNLILKINPFINKDNIDIIAKTTIYFILIKNK